MILPFHTRTQRYLEDDDVVFPYCKRPSSVSPIYREHTIFAN